MILCYVAILLADMPSPTRDEISGFVVIIVGFLGGLYFLSASISNIKKIFEKPTPKSEEMFVTEQKFQADLKQIRDELTSKLSKMEINVAACSTKEEVKELREYTSKSVHEIRNDLNPIALKMESVTVMMVVHKEQSAENSRMLREHHNQFMQVLSSNKDAMDRMHATLESLRMNGMGSNSPPNRKAGQGQ